MLRRLSILMWSWGYGGLSKASRNRPIECALHPRTQAWLSNAALATTLGDRHIAAAQLFRYLNRGLLVQPFFEFFIGRPLDHFSHLRVLKYT